MKNFSEILGTAVDFLFFYPKSTSTLLIFLSVVVAIAFYVNRKRDATGKISFVDMSRTGITGLRLYETENGIRKNSRLLPLWIPEAHLILNIRTVLAKGEYEIRAYWKSDKYHLLKENLLKKQPVIKENAYSLSHSVKFEVQKDMPVEFKLTASDKNLQIDSPNKESLSFNSERPLLPLIISDTSFKKLAHSFDKLKKIKIWELSVIDDQIITSFENEIKSMSRKLDMAVIKNQELESNLNKMVSKLMYIQKSEKSVQKDETPEKTAQK